MLQSGEQVWERRARKSLERGGVSLEGVSGPRARRSLTRGCVQPLERGGVSPEGTSSPRARRSLARGGTQPSSDVESRPRGRPALERGGVSLVQCCVPRAKRSFAWGGLGLSVLVGRWGRQDRGPLPLGCDRFGCILLFCELLCVLFAKENGFPPII
jgi:hypothetical protein